MNYCTSLLKIGIFLCCFVFQQLFKLKRAAYSRGVRLLYLPQNFSKHRENSTYFEWKSNNFYWRIEWTFFTDSGIKKIVDER